MPEARQWFVSYDVTGRSIVLQYGGDDEHQISSEEARSLADDLLAAAVAENEHRVLLGDREAADLPTPHELHQETRT